MAGLSAAARNLLGEFDTGCWSRYSLGGAPATPHYHDYHVRLLGMLAKLEGHAVWHDTLSRWDGYRRSGGPTVC